MRRLLARRPAPVLPCLVSALALLLAACGGGDGEGEGGGGGTTAEETTTTTAPPISVLTGLPVDPALAGRPAVTVKVDNSPQGRPQSGLDKTDVVIEEKVEGGVTRLLAVFHSQDADPVGPVRSVRSTDVPLVTPVGGVFAFSGGIPAFQALVRRAPLVAVSEDGQGKAFKSRAGRRRPYRTYTSTAELRSLAGDRARPPGPLVEFLAPGQPFAPPGAAPATHASVVFGPTTRSAWDFDPASGQWLRTTNGTPHTLEGGARLAVANVVVQVTPYRATPHRDPSGSQVDEGAVVGTGDGIILTQGMHVRVRWSKPSPEAPTTYALPDGTPVKLPPGRTWVALPPPGTAIEVR